MAQQIDKLLDQYGKAHKDPRNKFCHKIGIPLIVVSIIGFLILGFSDPWMWGLFIVGWIFQFIGHAFEKTWPEFMRNPVFLLIGPLYFIQEIRKKRARKN